MYLHNIGCVCVSLLNKTEKRIKKPVIPVCRVKWAQVRAQQTLQLPGKFTLCFQDVLKDLVGTRPTDRNTHTNTHNLIFMMVGDVRSHRKWYKSSAASFTLKIPLFKSIRPPSKYVIYQKCTLLNLYYYNYHYYYECYIKYRYIKLVLSIWFCYHFGVIKDLKQRILLSLRHLSLTSQVLFYFIHYYAACINASSTKNWCLRGPKRLDLMRESVGVWQAQVLQPEMEWLLKIVALLKH